MWERTGRTVVTKPHRTQSATSPACLSESHPTQQRQKAEAYNTYTAPQAAAAVALLYHRQSGHTVFDLRLNCHTQPWPAV